MSFRADKGCMKNYDESTGTWIRKVSEEFYSLVYEHPWLKQVFANVPQEHITNQQVDFVIGAFGGPQAYSGRNPGDAHPHIFISEEMWEVREEILKLAFERTQCPAEISVRWLKIENAFKKQIVMKDPSECKGRFTTDELIIIPKPKQAA